MSIAIVRNRLKYIVWTCWDNYSTCQSSTFCHCQGPCRPPMRFLTSSTQLVFCMGKPRFCGSLPANKTHVSSWQNKWPRIYNVSVDQVRLLAHALDNAPQVGSPINSWSTEISPPTVLLIWPVVICVHLDDDIWRFLEIGVSLFIIHLRLGLSLKKHPAIGVSPFMETPCGDCFHSGYKFTMVYMGCADPCRS